MKVEKLDHLHIYSRDPEGSAAFYKERFEAVEVLRDENVYGQTNIFPLRSRLPMVSWSNSPSTSRPPDKTLSRLGLDRVQSTTGGTL